MSKEKNEENKAGNWPISVSGSTESYYSGNTYARSNSDEINNVLECMSNLSFEFNEKYSVKEKLISLVTKATGYDYGGTNFNFGSVAFHVTSMETNKSRRLMSLEILKPTIFQAELSIFTDSGRVVIATVSSCSELKNCFLKTLTDPRITEQLKHMRTKSV